MTTILNSQIDFFKEYIELSTHVMPLLFKSKSIFKLFATILHIDFHFAGIQSSCKVIYSMSDRKLQFNQYNQYNVIFQYIVDTHVNKNKYGHLAQNISEPGNIE